MNPSELIRAALSGALAREGVTIDAGAIPLSHPTEFAHGDYASGVALQCAKEAGTSPRSLAEKLVASMGEIEGVSKIEVAGPGFVNFRLSSASIARLLQEARSSGEWGKNAALAGEVVLLEYTSPNLFKPLHVGNLVGNIVGESIARLMQLSGAEVKRINYPSDIGLTVAKGVWGLLKTGGDPADIKALGEAYRAGNEGYESDPASKQEIEAINKKLYEDSDPELSRLRRAGIETSRRHLDAICAALGTAFDKEIFESEAGPIGLKLVTEHVEDGVFERSDGAIVFPGEKRGLHTRVFVNSAGLPTYEAKDLGNFELKQEAFPSWNRSYVVTGAEQQEYFKVVIAAIKQVFPAAADKTIGHVPTGFLTLTTGKMSSRKGNVLTGESLLEDLGESAKERAALSRADDREKLAESVAVAAIKYQILKQSSGKNIIFDREKALSLEGDSGPYLQYAHARMRAILEKAKADGIEPALDAAAAPIELSRLAYRFPETIERAANEYQPHHVATFLIELASAFNSWYGQTQILDGTAESAHKVAIVEAACAALGRGLWALGIPAPEKM